MAPSQPLLDCSPRLDVSPCCACRFWGWFFAVTTLLVWLFKQEDNFQPTGD